MRALAAGYDVLLEKPLARTEEECIELREQARKYGRKFMVCHVLRYTPFYSRVKQLIDEGVLGDIVTIVHTEGLGNIHQSHSFVRGNWGNTAKSNFMLPRHRPAAMADEEEMHEDPVVRLAQVLPA